MSRLPFIALACSAILYGQQQPQPQKPSSGVPAEIIVTVGHYYTGDAPALNVSDLVVTQGFEQMPITALVPLRDARGALELYLLVDNCSNCEPGSKINEIRQFIVSQPATTAIGVAYIKNGEVQVLQSPTTDHELAFGSLSAPSGSNPANPYLALTALINGWKAHTPRRAVVMISTGVDPVPKEGMRNATVEGAIQAAERAGVVVYAIYHPAADYDKTDSARLYEGQVQLAHMAIETGGEAYFTGFGPLPTLGPLLFDISHHLANQYLLKFVAKPNANSDGGLEQIRVESKSMWGMLNVPDRVWIPGRHL